MCWIKMSEMHPDDNERVLVTLQWNDGSRTVEHTTWFEHLSGRENYGFGLWNDNVIAWMPYPKAYRGE